MRCTQYYHHHFFLFFLLQKWRQIFDKFDQTGFGEIPVNEFLIALKSPELQSQVPFNKIELLYHRALKSKEPHGTGSISFQEFVNVVSICRYAFAWCAVIIYFVFPSACAFTRLKRIVLVRMMAKWKKVYTQSKTWSICLKWSMKFSEVLKYLFSFFSVNTNSPRCIFMVC